MANSFLNPTWILKKFTARVHNQLKFAGNLNTNYDDSFVVKGAKVGDTVYARLPQMYEVSDGDNLVKQSITDSTVPISITDHLHIGISLTAREQVLNEDNYADRFIYPAADKMANEIDLRCLSRMTKKTFLMSGTPGTTPTANTTYTGAVTKLYELASPDPLIGVFTADMMASIQNANNAVFNPQGQLSKAFRTGRMAGPALGIEDWYADENCYTHTAGVQTGAPTVNGASQVGSSVIVQSWTALGTAKEGDVVQFAGCQSVNPLSKQSTGRLMDFVCTADATASAGGAITLTISPAIVTSGAYQNVSASPTNGGAVTIFGSASAHSGRVFRQGLVFHKSAYALVMADAPLYKSAAWAERIQDDDLGVSFTLHKQFDINTFAEPARIDCFFGVAAIRPEFGIRVMS